MPCNGLQVSQLYRERIPEDAVVLDLMSSWVSHLPPEKKYKRVVGHGMNAAEVSKFLFGHAAEPLRMACCNIKPCAQFAIVEGMQGVEPCCAAGAQQAAGQLLCEEFEPGPHGMGSGGQKRGCRALLRQRPVSAVGNHAPSHDVHQQTGLLQLMICCRQPSWAQC